MSDKIFAFAFMIFAFVIVGSAEANKKTKETRPNIVLIFLDDLGYADVGFNAELFGVKTDVVTPNIDRLARSGAIFKQAYVTHPFCGPSRMGLLSGRMPHTFGGQKNLPNHCLNLHDFNSKGIPLDEKLMSSMLRDAGYITGCVGKWHMGASKPHHPNQRGFDQFYGFVGGGHQYFPWLSDKVTPKVNDYQYFLERNGKEFKSPEGEYLTDMLSDEAVRFVGDVAKKQKPFFLYLAYNAPHAPLQGKLEDLQHLYPNHKPANPKNGVDFKDYQKRQNYVAMVYAVDRGIEKIRSALNDPNEDGDDSDSIADNTLIVFLSDNGGKIAQAANNSPLQDDKGSTREGGIRVPMFMAWPGKIAAGKMFDYPVSSLDFYPTFANLAGAKIPNDKKLDGKNIWDDFMAGKNPRAEEPLYWLRHHGGGNEVAILQGNLKAYRKQFGAWNVFDVSTDVGESKDIAESNQKALQTMIANGLEWSKTHIPPRWHDTQAGLDSWNEKNMPQYERTFQMRATKIPHDQSKLSQPKPFLNPKSKLVLTIPELSDGPPTGGKRVAVKAPEYQDSNVFHTIYLPKNWRANGKKLPIIFEYTGNYHPPSGSTGKVEGAGLGYGLSGGRCIWVSLPFINKQKNSNQVTWWGDQNATVAYAKQNVPGIIKRFNADPKKVLLCGFSRGAIGVNFLGLHDDEVAKLWTGFVTHDHFDGVKEWRGTDWGSPLDQYRLAAVERLKRVGNRPYLVSQNGHTREIKKFIQSSLPESDLKNFTFSDVSTKAIFGEFPNTTAKHPHTDRFLLKPSKYRTTIWQWINSVFK